MTKDTEYKDRWEDNIFIRMKEEIREDWANAFRNSIFKYDQKEETKEETCEGWYYKSPTAILKGYPKYWLSHFGEGPIPDDEAQFYNSLPNPKTPPHTMSTLTEQEKKELEYFLGEDIKIIFGEDVDANGLE